jgi:hypothetical protein
MSALACRQQLSQEALVQKSDFSSIWNTLILNECLASWLQLKSSQPQPLGHSARSAATGFTDAARCAGI